MTGTSEVMRQDEDCYVLRDHLTHAEVIANADRLRREGEEQLRHADALLAWAERRRPEESAR